MTGKPIKPYFKMIQLKDLIIDPRYQRDLNKARVKKIADSFDHLLYGALAVSERPGGSYAVFDGQHRLEVAKTLDFNEVPCVIFQGLSAQKEAGLFNLLQTERKSLTAFDRFKARVFSGEKAATTIAAILKKHNYEVAQRGLVFGETDTRIQAVVGLDRIYNKYGPGHLDSTLKEIRELWGEDEGTANGRFVEGMALFLAEYGDHRYDKEVKDRLVAVSPLVIVRRASTVHAGDDRPAQAVYEVIKKISKLRGRPRRFVVPIT